MSKNRIVSLEDFWPYQVVLLADLVSRHTNSVLKSHGKINLSQWRVLAAIGDNPGRMASEVVAMTPMDKGIVSRATTALVEDGLVKKKIDPNDRRRAELFLTARGQKQYDQISQALTRALNTLDVPERLNAVLHSQIKNMQDLLDQG